MNEYMTPDPDEQDPVVRHLFVPVDRVDGALVGSLHPQRASEIDEPAQTRPATRLHFEAEARVLAAVADVPFVISEDLPADFVGVFSRQPFIAINDDALVA